MYDTNCRIDHIMTDRSQRDAFITMDYNESLASLLDLFSTGVINSSLSSFKRMSHVVVVVVALCEHHGFIYFCFFVLP